LTFGTFAKNEGGCGQGQEVFGQAAACLAETAHGALAKRSASLAVQDGADGAKAASGVIE